VEMSADLPQRLAGYLLKMPADAETLMCSDLANTTGFKLAKKISEADIADIRGFLSDFQSGKMVKSEQRPENDMDPEHDGLTVLTTNTFEEIALDPDTECFVDIYADWCGPCVQFKPTLFRLAKVLQNSGIKVCKFNSELNQKIKEFMPENSIPVLKFIPKGSREEKLK